MIKIYASNVGGKRILVRARSMKEAAHGLGVTLYAFREYSSVTNRSPDTEVDYDFTGDEDELARRTRSG